MSLPGFTGTPTGVPAGDRIVPQHITCEEEQGPPCTTRCKHSWNPAVCRRECIEERCSASWGES
ncbi:MULTISPECIES: hypothetical protein [Streptomyces]|uniref:Uncharacterized protein n=1 Tax=Streptomyces stelliscabiei TaxID=146820 RepID=A0A8I0P1L9_9ACTN|nr:MULTISPECIES: hypothetical protein [Streptomyces]KND43743.1 hypothetical protein IQ64_16475 [Streptomyces stelliscabiei]MBE1596545.1 hypothetical protein [Streptomyces stelliscabiei]MDX2517877.1 hypothetical protein [Streptomyces stelliscabiei]MDX2551164.1 hypothetical protein [Streptomyces stelliscabiei]MDX2615370.1 hypothetical protein [Streptomyces stelliscabiei]